MHIPSLIEFEEALFIVEQEANAVVENMYNEEKEKGNLLEDGQVKDVSSVGSTIMYLDRRKSLFKFFASIVYDPDKFYFVMVYNRNVYINLRKLKSGQSYMLNRAAYNIVAQRLSEIFEWEVFNDVKID